MSHVGEALVVLFIALGLVCCHAIDSGTVDKYQQEKTKQKQLELEIKQAELKKLETVKVSMPSNPFEK